MLSFATSPQTPAIRAGWTTKLHLAPGTRRRIPPAEMGDLVGRKGGETTSLPYAAFGDRPPAKAGPARTAFRGPF